MHPGDETFLWSADARLFFPPPVLSLRGGDQDKTMIDLKNAEPSRKRKVRKKKKGNFFFLGSDRQMYRARCTVFEFFSFAFWVYVSEWKSVSNFLGYRNYERRLAKQKKGFKHLSERKGETTEYIGRAREGALYELLKFYDLTWCHIFFQKLSYLPFFLFSSLFAND